MNKKIEMIAKQMKRNELLTLEKLKVMEPGIFATGLVKDDRLYRELELKWVAVRGGIHDWAIYYHLASSTDGYVRDSGDKCFTRQVIRELVPCNDEAFAMYRF